MRRWEDYSRGHLFRYVGTYNYEAVLDDPILRPELELLFGPHLPHFLRNILEDRFAINYEEPGIVMRGYGTEPSREQAILFVGVRGDRVYGAIFSNDVTTVFSNGKDFAELPPAVLTWVHKANVWRLIDKEPKTGYHLVKDLFR